MFISVSLILSLCSESSKLVYAIFNPLHWPLGVMNYIFFKEHYFTLTKSLI